MTKMLCLVMYGMGGAALDPLKGQRYIVEQLQAKGVVTEHSPYEYTDTQIIVDRMLAEPKSTMLALGGDSCGANAIPLVASALKRQGRKLTYIWAIQPSLHCGLTKLPDNVLYARVFWNSNMWMTGGLGGYRLPLETGNKVTKIDYEDVQVPHPGNDNPHTQALIMLDVDALLKGE